MSRGKNQLIGCEFDSKESDLHTIWTTEPNRNGNQHENKVRAALPLARVLLADAPGAVPSPPVGDDS